jgi:hypothetical protein
MSNDVKWTEWRSSDVVADQHATSDTAKARTAWLQLLGCVLGLGLVAAGLPGPRSLLSFLTDGVADPDHTALPGASAQAAILATAGLVVWVLLIWTLAVGAAAMAGRLPGVPGLIGRSVLRRIAPAAAGRLVAAAVGVSLLAGTSACAPAIASIGSGSSAAAVGLQSPGTTSVPVGDGSGVVDPAPSAGSTIAAASPAPSEGTPTPIPAVPSTDGVIGSIVIDWPDAAGSMDAAPSTPNAAAESGGQTPSSPAASASATANTDATTADPDSAPPTPTATTDPSAQAPEPAPGSETPSSPAPALTDAPESPQPDHTSATTPQTDDDHRDAVEVRGGDSLWSIAAHRLPPDSADSDIDSAWRAWYLANQQVIGDNPDLIQPGQLLLPPNQK